MRISSRELCESSSNKEEGSDEGINPNKERTFFRQPSLIQIALETIGKLTQVQVMKNPVPIKGCKKPLVIRKEDIDADLCAVGSPSG